MKRVSAIVSILILVFSFSLVAQDDYSPQYLFSGDGKPSISGFGGPFVEFSGIQNEFAVSVGGGGAVLLNQTFYVGGYGEGLTTSHYRYDLEEVVDFPAPKIAFGHGGFWLGYMHNSYKAIHFSASAKIGWGAISLYDSYYNYEPKDYWGKDAVFVAIPQVEAEMNLTPWFKINLAVGYRLVGGVDKSYIGQDGNVHQYYNASDFNSPEGTISFLFGGFGK